MSRGFYCGNTLFDVDNFYGAAGVHSIDSVSDCKLQKRNAIRERSARIDICHTTDVTCNCKLVNFQVRLA